MDLAVLSVDLFLAAHGSMSHGQAVLKTSCFQPRLTPYLHAQFRDQGLDKIGLVKGPSNYHVLTGVMVDDGSCRLEVVLDPKNVRQHWVAAPVHQVMIDQNRLVSLEDEPCQPLCISWRQPLVEVGNSEARVSTRLAS